MTSGPWWPRLVIPLSLIRHRVLPPTERALGSHREHELVLLPPICLAKWLPLSLVTDFYVMLQFGRGEGVRDVYDR